MLKIETFRCTFYSTEFECIITSNYPNIVEVKHNLTYLLRKKAGKLQPEEQEFAVRPYQGKSNRKVYKEYEDKKGTYIKYGTGTSVKPGCIKIYK